jgi:hypothetical protein
MRHWQRRRVEFNHDWLKNRFLPALDRAVNVLRGDIEDAEYAHAFLTILLPDWELAAARAADLCDGFEREMSPRCLLDEYPLSLLEAGTRDWLGTLLHEVWLTRFPVRRWVQDALDRVAAADASYRQVVAHLRGNAAPAAEPLLGFAPLLEQLGEDCRALARALERFPRTVLVV